MTQLNLKGDATNHTKVTQIDPNKDANSDGKVTPRATVAIAAKSDVKVHTMSMGCLWGVNGLSVGSRWIVGGLSVDCRWIVGGPMVLHLRQRHPLVARLTAPLDNSASKARYEY